MFFIGFCLLYVKIWNLLISWPVSFSWWPHFPKHISPSQCLLELTLTLLETVFLRHHIYCKCKAFIVLKNYLAAYNLLPCSDISMFWGVFLRPFISWELLNLRAVPHLFQQGVLLIPSYGSLGLDPSPLQRLSPSGWEEMPGPWWNLFSTQLERHALFSLLSTSREHNNWVWERTCPSEVFTYTVKCD